jgi:hypothetical protein
MLCKTEVKDTDDKILVNWLTGDFTNLEEMLKDRNEREFSDAVMDWISQKDEKTLARLFAADIKIEDFAVSKLTKRRRTLIKAYLESIEKLKPTVKGVAAETLPIKPAKSYFIKEERPLYSFQIFESAINAGMTGLCITRQNPQEITERFKISGAQIYWLRKLPARNYLDPGNLVSIANVMKDYIRSGEKCVILLEGIEYLISNNGFQHVLNMVEYITEYISNSASSLMISANPSAFVERELALLEKDLIPIATQPAEKIVLAPTADADTEKIGGKVRTDLDALKYRKRRRRAYAR